MKKIIISVVTVILSVSIFCVSAFAVDASKVNNKYNNKIDYVTGVAGFMFGEGSGGPWNNTTRVDQKFTKLTFDENIYNLQNPTMYASFRNPADITDMGSSSDETIWEGDMYYFGGSSNGGKLIFEFIFEGQNDNFSIPNLNYARFSYPAFLEDSDDYFEKYVYLTADEIDFTVSVAKSPWSSESKYYTYKLIIDPDSVGYPFYEVRFCFDYTKGDYHFYPVLREVSCSYISENEYNNSLEAEKEEANESGNGAVDDLTGALGGVNSEGFLSAFRNLAASMSYDGTDAKWEFPALSIPAIAGVTDKIELSDSQDIDLVAFVDDIPENILTLIRAVFDIALIIFCVKELYSLIQYLLTLKGGRSDE